MVKDHLINRKYPSFHIVNALGWILLIAADSIIVSPKEVFSSSTMFISNTVEWATGYLTTLFMRSLYLKLDYRSRSLIVVLGYILIVSTIASLIFYFSAHLIYLLIYTEHADKFDMIYSVKYITLRMTQIFPLMVSWSLLYFGFKFWLELNIERERAEKADLMAQNAQLQMLRYQVNPHFLFNAFSSLRALIRTDSKKAEEMIGKMSEFYRYSLLTKNNAEVPLKDEIAAIKHYAEIEKIRFGDKIEFNFYIDSLAEEYPVPGFIINPLVENAVKYGMKTSDTPLTINISASVNRKRLLVEVSNTGSWLDQTGNLGTNGTGTGLENIKRRLEYSYPGNHKFTIVKEKDFVKVSFEITRYIK